MPSGRLDALFRSLRFQLTFWNTAAIFLLVLATLVGLRIGLRSSLQKEMDHLLDEDVLEVRLIVKRFHPDWRQVEEELNRKAVSHKARAWFARIFTPQGVPLVATTGAPDLGDYPPPAFAASISPVQGTGPCNVDDYRVVQSELNEPGRGLVLRVGCSRDFVNDDVANLTRILVFAGLAFLVVAPLSGYLLAGRATRPLAVILRTTAGLRPGRLHERVPLRGSGDELDQLAGTLNDLLDRLASHLDRQRAFVANAAHELRSPLAALRTSAEVALAQERPPEEYRELLADMVEGCDALGGLVNQLLLLAEGDAGLVRSAGPVDLARLAAGAVEMFRGIAEVGGVALELTAGGPVVVHGSDTHLRQVVSNLIDNAIKFTPPGGSVGVAVRREETSAVLEVRDTGVGIPAEDLPHIFERFYRADKARRRDAGVGGNGLGLSICQALVGAHEGRIVVGGRPGGGTVVTVTLPALPERTKDAEKDEGQRTKSA
jgi:signal transduction histidine kinase